MSKELVLEVKNLKTIFKSRGQEVQAVRGVEFSVEKGEIMGIVGESGSGKSVTMKAVMGILPENIPGYNSVIKSHLTVAAAIAEGEADFALGTERISNQIDGIDFIPLMKERYDLVLRKSFLDSVAAQRLLEILNMPAFRAEISHYSGNDYRDLGKIIKEV